MISIILPIFNAENFLAACLDSLYKQTHEDYELICMDDGSTDNSLNIVLSYAKKDKRVKVYSRENKGLVYTLNEAINLCKYRYIARMDADDICEPERLKSQLDLMNKKGLAVVGCSYNYIDAKGNYLNQRILPQYNFLVRYLMDFGSPFCHPSVLFDKNVLGNDLFYQPSYKNCEDLELWFRLRNLNYNFGNVKAILFNYRVLDTSISRVFSKEQATLSENLVLKYCYYVKSNCEAKYLLSERKSLKNNKFVFLFFYRALRKFNIVQAFFIFMYLIR